jgi:branched-chain amino acid transport system substrate-binding protein
MKLFSAIICILSVMLCQIMASAAETPLEINAVLSLTGPGAFLGTREAAALGVVERMVNVEGGIHGRPIKFVVADDQTSPAVSVQLTNALIARHAPVIIGSSLAATCSAMASLVEKTGPLEYCLSPVITGAPGSYVYSASAGSDSIAAVLVRYYRERGWTKIALITSTDASGVDFEKQFNAALGLAENAMVKVVAREHFAPADLSVTAQMVRIKSAQPQAIITFATGTPLGTLLHGYHDVGLQQPISASGGNMIYAQMEQYKQYAPENLVFAATGGIAPNDQLHGPVRDAQMQYFDNFKAAGIRPDFASSLAWDPSMILVAALRALGPDASADQIHAWISHLHNYVGVDGMYDFRDNSQRGLGQNAMVIYRWDPANANFVVVSKPAGHVK